MKKSIEIDLEVYRAIEMQRMDFDESQNDILRRVLGLEATGPGPDLSRPIMMARLSRPVHNQLQGFEPPEPGEFRNASMQSPQPSLGDRIKEFHSRISGQFQSRKPAAARDWQFGGVRLPEGTRLQKWYGGQKYEAEIRDGAIWFDGASYQSPSAAAMVITGGSNVSGWNFWKFFDPQDGEWKKLSSLKAGLKEEGDEITKL